MNKKERKKRRRERRNKNGVAKHQKTTLSKAENEACWAWARLVTARQQKNRHLANIPVYCPTCKKVYCLGFDNVDQYCETCYYYPCQKETNGGRICQKCERRTLCR